MLQQALLGAVLSVASVTSATLADNPLTGVIPAEPAAQAPARFRFFVKDEAGKLQTAPRLQQAVMPPGYEDPRLTFARNIVSAHAFSVIPFERRLALAARLAPRTDCDGRPYKLGPWDLLPPVSETEYKLKLSSLVSRKTFFSLRPVHQRALVSIVDRRLAGEEPIAFCFAPDADPVLVDTFNALMFPIGPAFQQNNRWSTTATNGGSTGGQGGQITLTYSFVPDGTQIANGGFGAGPSDLQAFLTGIYGSPAVWRQIYSDVFNAWGNVCGVTYVLEPNDDGVQTNVNGNAGILGTRGDLRMAGKALDGNSGVLAYNNFPNNGDMVVDTTDSFYSNTSNSSRRLRNVLSHEHGHGMGQNHVCPSNGTKLMEPFIITSFLGPQLDDILNAQRHYGDNDEPNDTALAAINLADAGPTLRTRRTISIDDNSDVDFYSFAVTAPARLSVTVRPFGMAYVQGPQTSACDATGTSTFDTRTVNDLILTVFATNGSTLLSFANDNGVGGNESVIVPIETSGTYFVRVSGGSADNIQPYELDYAILPGGLVIAIPSGTPAFLVPGQPTTFQVDIQFPGESLVGTPKLFYRSAPGPFQSTDLQFVSGSTWNATLPGFPCGSTPQFYIEGAGTTSGNVRVPALAPLVWISSFVGVDLATVFTEDGENGAGWSLGVPGDTATSGIWIRAVPVGTTSGGAQVQPAADNSPPPGTRCFVTGNGAVGGSVGDADVDNGFTTLMSPAIDLSGAGPVTISFARWYSNARGSSPAADTFRIDVSNNNGQSWVNARTVGPSTENDGGWIADSINLNSLVAPTSQVRFRFVATDAGQGSLVEAAIDDIVVMVRGCTPPPPTCPADFNGDGFRNPDDLADFITCFFLDVQFPGFCPEADFNQDAFRNPDDLADFITVFFLSTC